jgi:hypothetical protein
MRKFKAREFPREMPAATIANWRLLAKCRAKSRGQCSNRQGRP